MNKNHAEVFSFLNKIIEKELGPIEKRICGSGRHTASSDRIISGEVPKIGSKCICGELWLEDK